MMIEFFFGHGVLCDQQKIISQHRFFEFDIDGNALVIGKFKRFLRQAEKLDQGFFFDGLPAAKKNHIFKVFKIHLQADLKQ